MPRSAVTHQLRRPFAWGTVVAAILLFSVMTYSYLGAFIDPVGNLKDLPVLVVNQDRPVDAFDETFAAGKEATDRILATHDPRVKWVVVASQAEAERRLRDNRAAGAIVFNRSFSQEVVDVGGAVVNGKPPKPARILILRNGGGGLFITSVFDVVSAEVQSQVSTEVNRQIAIRLDKASLKVRPDDTSVVGNPVVVQNQSVVTLGDKSGRGLAPFYFSIMVALGAFIGTILVSINVDAMRGDEDIEVFGRRLPLERNHTGPWGTWLTKEAMAIPLSLIGPWLSVFVAVGVIHMQVSSSWKLGLFASLASLAISQFTVLLVTLFGIGGELFGVLFLTIFGVPAALGVYPQQSIPTIPRIVSVFHPLRYLCDGSRAIAFFDARASAGLGRAVWALLAWTVGSAVVGFVCARLLERRCADDPPPPAIVEETLVDIDIDLAIEAE